MAREIDNLDDIIDSREIIERIEELEADEAELADSDLNELALLRDLTAEAANTGIENWEHGATLIRDSYFVEYTRELAEETVEGLEDAKWPFSCIDWEKAA